LKEDYGAQFDATAADYLNQIMRASTRMNRLVQDLLEYGRLNRIEIVPESIALRRLVAKVVAEVAPPEANVRIDIDPALAAAAHEATLTQIMTNLIANAVKFVRPGESPQVTITAALAERAGFVRIAVSDKGIGIAPQHQDKIFKVFERLHGIEEYPGTGIGLAIVKRGAERMGGRVGLQSEVGKGSTFWVELPQAQGRTR